MKVKIEVSARHIHLSQEHADILFGKNYEFKVFKELSQPGQFAYEEKVKIIGPKGEMDGVRVLGPVRKKTQIEVSETDARKLGVNPPVRESGDLAGSAGIKVIGAEGEVILEEGVIIAMRHIHIDPATAEELGVKNGDKVKVDVSGPRDLVFENIVVRVNPQFRFVMHIDTDEANAAEINNTNNEGELII